MGDVTQIVPAALANRSMPRSDALRLIIRKAFDRVQLSNYVKPSTDINMGLVLFWRLLRLRRC